MPLTFTVHELILLVAAALPAVVGYFVWCRRPKPGASSLALILWTFALWAIAQALQLGTRDEQTAFLFYKVGEAVMLAAAPLWLVFVLQYTGRYRWLTRWRLIPLCGVPLISLALIATNGSHELMWTFEGLRGSGSMFS
ncbi:MAG: hypothetical protein H0W54_00360, partial [Rubrobacter sp.]|nr:hypothetical protein [Rubrobacter sp.]